MRTVAKPLVGVKKAVEVCTHAELEMESVLKISINCPPDSLYSTTNDLTHATPAQR
jgi:hypothetical protein